MQGLGPLSCLHGSGPCDLHSPVPLGHDGISGSLPLPWAHQPELVWATRSKEHLEGQPGVSKKEPGDAGFGTDEGAQFVHVGDIVCLQGLALAKPTSTRGWKE